MARAIRARPQPSEGVAARGEPIPSLAPDLGDSASAIAGLLELLRLLEERGFLRWGSDLLRSEERIVSVLTEQVDPKELRALAKAPQVLGSALAGIDRATAAWLGERLPTALAEAQDAGSGPPMGAIELVRALEDPEVNRGARMVIGFLRGLGRGPGR